MYLKIIQDPIKNEDWGGKIYRDNPEKIPKMIENTYECDSAHIVYYDDSIEIRWSGRHCDNFILYKDKNGNIKNMAYLAIFMMNNDGKTIDSHSWQNDNCMVKEN